jgi:hypothetical protein
MEPPIDSSIAERTSHKFNFELWNGATVMKKEQALALTVGQIAEDQKGLNH